MNVTVDTIDLLYVTPSAFDGAPEPPILTEAEARVTMRHGGLRLGGDIVLTRDERAALKPVLEQITARVRRDLEDATNHTITAAYG